MLCEHCGKNPATVHVTKIINNKKTEAHLCPQCAQGSGELSYNFDFPNFISSLFEQAQKWGTPTIQPKSCPVCSLSFDDFRRLGQLGCSECYATFRSELGPIIRRMHGATKHIGKVPVTTHAKLRIDREIRHLREQLEQAVQVENYEKAAQLRDQIRALEKDRENNVRG